uniref:FAM161 centrosomal protein B n=1 Tax=Esox lucius TaxID=8010 RepID=A0A3P8XUB3_ESOLU
MSDSGVHTSDRMQEQRNMTDLQAFLEDGLRSELLLQQQLQAGPARSSSMSDLTSGKRYNSKISQQVRQSGRSVTSSAARAKTAPQRKVPWELQHQGSTETERPRPSKEEEEEAECQRKFRAVPVPIHVVVPLYNDMMKTRERERKEGCERRRDFLLSTQKPFSFLERDEKKGEKLMQMICTMAQSQMAKATVRKPIPKAIKDPAVSEHLKEEELQRKIRIQQRAQETLRKSTAPIENQAHTENPEPRTAQRTKMEVLAFLYQKPTFKPKTNSLVPDFDRLHKAFQREALRRAERTDMTKCQPFHLRTSTKTSRPSRSISEKQHEPTALLKRSNSLGGLTSLSTDTLPTYITDAARKRCMAIRMSVLQRENTEQESVEFMRKHRMRSQAMKKTVAVRAKVTDPHSSLKEVYHEKLKKHREADQQRMKEYKKELQDIKTRVTVRPFLFEQVSQKKAKADAERIYGDKLREAGLNEQFVKTKGEELLTTQVLKSDDDCDNQSVESDTEKRYLQ